MLFSLSVSSEFKFQKEENSIRKLDYTPEGYTGEIFFVIFNPIKIVSRLLFYVRIRNNIKIYKV